ncbi:SLC13 family permease [Aestuariirhabdus litorea]|uniref:Sodium:solute symporter n=1 Tax=Aestuariirhabdus litorea TaxID=2528527 RepID=A0A3P3VJI4_9GAMM|nr:SLC13 family permease [Aestuariirhabdus litorea]RRJ82477.1 sodium:solute symporter [Aestuariirhabdus litorea]RWW92638.1 sodium:solute symporter [Endozoicomonadaceae bacterium GTF-13]
MNAEIGFVFGVLAITVALFIWDRIRMDLVALGVVLVLALSGIITPAQAVSGFGNSIVVMIAALFVVGEALFRTGVAAATGQWILRVGGRNEQRLLLLLIPVVALLSAFMSSTGAVALFIPVVMSIARSTGMSPSRLLMPLAFASLIGGMLTLIGTPPNIVVSGLMTEAGLEGFGFFDFTPIGLLILLVGLAYLVLVGRRLLPAGATEADGPHTPLRRLSDFAERYGIENHLYRLQVLSGSPLIGKTVVEAGVRTQYEITLYGIRRRGKLLSSMLPVLAETRIENGDYLMVYGELADILRFCDQQRCAEMGFPEVERERARKEFGVAEVLVYPQSRLLGKTIKSGRFREQYHLSVIGMKRNNEPVTAQFNGETLQAGDTLLLLGGWSFIEALRSNSDFVVIDTPAEVNEVPTRAAKAPLALAIMVGMLVAMVAGWLPSLSAILLAAVAMVASGCVTLPEAYRSFNAMSLVLIAGMLPLALAMDKTGALGLLADQLINHLGESSPLLVCLVLFLLTSLFSQFISNTATTVLVGPIALATAQGLGLSPAPFMMMVAIAASTAFCTPIASPVNTLVLAPGNYRFIDFVKVGVPLQLLALGVAMVAVPWVFPFAAV